MNLPVTLTCGGLTTRIGTLEVPLRPKLSSSELSPLVDSHKVTVAAEVDTAKLGRNLAALLRQAADSFDDRNTTREGSGHV